MKNLYFLFAFFLFFSACEEDEYGKTLTYTICDSNNIFSAEEKTNIKILPIAEISEGIRTFIAIEFTGFGIKSAASFETNTGNFIEITATNDGKLLFDIAGGFICGDESFGVRQYGDIAIDDLPQNILDYITENYPDTSIDEAEIEDGEYEVELKNGIDLYFDIDGNFLREG